MNAQPHRAHPTALTVEIGYAELLDELESLWLALFDHHADIGAGGLLSSTDRSPG